MQSINKLNIPNDIQIIAAVKYFNADQIACLQSYGLTNLGWSTIQHMEKTIEEKPEINTAYRHHFIGHLQTNKVGKLLDRDITLIHSVDSERLVIELEKQAAKHNKTQNILLQIKTDKEKPHGLTTAAAENIIENRARYPHLHIEGVMTIPPPCKNPEDNRAIFKTITDFAHEMEKKYHHPLPHISMGMSGDYQVAIKEGATMVRIGSLLANLFELS